MLSTVIQACRHALTKKRRNTGRTPSLGLESLEDRTVPSTFQVVDVDVIGTSSATAYSDIVGTTPPTTETATGMLDQFGSLTRNAGRVVQTYMSATESMPTEYEYSSLATSQLTIETFPGTVLDYDAASANGEVTLTTAHQLLIAPSQGEQVGDLVSVTITTDAAKQMFNGWTQSGTLTYTLGTQTGQLGLTDGEELVLDGQVGETLTITTNVSVSGSYVAFTDDGGLGVTAFQTLGFHAQVDSQAVTPTPPLVVQLNGDSSVDEGQTYSLDIGYTGDVGANPVTGWVVDWGDGNVENFTTGGTKTHVYADGPATHTINVDLVVMNDGVIASGMKGITVNNVGPFAGGDSGASYTTDANTPLVLPDLLANDTDPGGDELTITGIDMTGTMGTVNDNGDGTYTYDPNGQFPQLGEGDTVTDHFMYHVSDGEGGTATAEVEITIEGLNEAPTVFRTIGDQQAALGYEYTLTLPLDLFTDVDSGDDLTLSAELLDGNPLPGWLTFDPATGTFQGTPTSQSDLGMSTIKVTATDTQGATASTDFTLTVVDTNQPPVITPGDSTVEVNEGESVSVQGTFEDLDGNDSVTLSSSIGTITQNGGGSWTWSYDTTDGPAESQTVIISASDGAGGTSTSTFDLIVHDVSPTIAITGNSSVAAGQQYSLDLGVITDPGNDTVTEWVVDWGDGNVETFTEGGVKTHTYAEGTYDIRIDLVDEEGTHTDRANALSVEAFGNQITISAIPDQIIGLNESTGPLPFTVNDTTTPAEDLVVTVSADDDSVFPLSGILLQGGGVNRTVTVTPALDQSGTTTITLTVSNSAGQTQSTSFEVRVNTAPELGDIPDQTIDIADGSLDVNLPATDAENDPLTFTVEFTSYDALYVVNQQFDFTASRHQNYLGYEEKWLWSNAQNNWYVLLPDGRLYATAGVAFGGYAGSVGPEVFNNVKLLTAAAPPASDVAVAAVVNNGVLTFTPEPSFGGRFRARVTVSDGVETDSKEFLVNVLNEEPTFDRTFDDISHSPKDFPLTTSGVTATDPESLSTTISVEVIGEGHEYEVQKEYQFYRSEHRNYLGYDEKWLWSATHRDWFVVLEDGRLYAVDEGDWGEYHGTVSPAVYHNLQLLTAPETPPAPNGVTAEIIGSDLVIHNTSNYLGKFEVVLKVTDGHSTTETGFYVESTGEAPEFNREVLDVVASRDQFPLMIDNITATDADGDPVTITAEVSKYSLAYELNSQYDFAASAHRDLWGQDEEWLYSNTTNQWFVLLPDGRLYQTDNGATWGDHVGTLSSDVHKELTLLTNAMDPGLLTGASASVANDDLELAIPGGYTGTFKVTLTASDGIVETMQSFYVKVMA